MQVVWLNHVTLMCYCILYFMLPHPHPYLYQHIQRSVLMLIFNMVSGPPSYSHGFLSLQCIKNNLCLPWCFFVAFIFFGFLLLPSKFSVIVMLPLEVASILQDHCLPQTTVTEPNFIQGIFSILSNLKISSSFHFEFERGCQRYISPLVQAQA